MSESPCEQPTPSSFSRDDHASRSATPLTRTGGIACHPFSGASAGAPLTRRQMIAWPSRVPPASKPAWLGVGVGVGVGLGVGVWVWVGAGEE